MNKMKYSKVISAILLSSIFIDSYANTKNDKCEIVIDAGSSGSRLHLFKITPSQDPSSNVPSNIEDLTEDSPIKIKPGISSFQEDPQQAKNSIKELFDLTKTSNFKKKIQECNSDISSIPVYLNATAGMRLVPKDTQKQIYSYIKKLPYNWKNKSPKTIPGWTEGLFDWLSLNYDNIKYNKATSGALDLGGASTQLAFDIKNINSKNFASQSKDDKKVTKIKLNKKKYEIFSISFLGLGQDKARENILKTSPNSFYYCFPKDTPVTLNTSGFNIISQGKFRPALCSWAAKRVIDQNDVYAKVHKYLTSEVTSKFNNKKFDAFSGFFYTSDFFDKSKNLKELEKSIRNKCTINWNNFKKNNLDTKPEYLINECINGSYALELLHNGYKFPVNRSDKVQFIPDADWTKGAALYYFLKSKE